MSSTRISEIIYASRDNVFTIEYTLDGGLFDFTNATKVEFELNGTAVNSVDNPEFFDFSVGTDGRVIYKLGFAGYVPEDSGGATVVVFDAVNTNGLVFSDPGSDIQLNIKII